MPDYTGGQFPSLDGDLESEVAQRTEPDTTGNWFRKVFTVHNRAHTRDLPVDHEIHLANSGAVLQAALQQGLHPKDAPELESETDSASDPESHTDLVYRVPVVPAVADPDPQTTVTPSILPQLLAQQAGGGGVPAVEPGPTTKDPETKASGKTPAKD